jgi:glycosyltransferase involved in cell wall biosynthesis
MISVVIRSKNEEQWIRRCLTAVSLQDCDGLEIIVVDNGSQDNTLDIAREFRCKVLTIDDREFSFGRALNMGIREARGEYVAVLSAHCIPLNNRWLARMAMDFTEEGIAAVYGRQEPLPDSDVFDKRDLWTVFGLEAKVQTKDFFFHNANSMIRRKLWESIPFDEELTGVEDRDWAKKVIERGYKIVYEPQASVYHFHGIHQALDRARCERVVRVIEFIHNGKPDKGS